jgi:hypothetical protein
MCLYLKDCDNFWKTVMKMKLLLLLLLLLAPANKLLVQEIPDCWCMPRYYPPNEEYFNEHFYFDTCEARYITKNCDSSYWLNINRTFDGRDRIYAKYYWLIWFDVKAFPLPYYDPDTTIEVTWRDADSVNYPEIKDSLEIIENEYGNFKMVKLHPELNQPGIGQAFRVSFDNYVNGVELENKFNSITFTNCDFKAGTYEINDIEDLYKDIYKYLIISPNPASEYIEIEVGVRHAVTLQNVQIQIFDVYGEYVLSVWANGRSPLHRIDISGLADGVYFLRIGNETQKFVVIK